jgi:MFS superfamily sulfate permease-like transporter
MFSNIKSDLKAGLVVFLVALPLCLGIALAQNAPLFSGIIAGVIGGIVVASISGSKLSVSGPAAGLTSIVLTSVTELGSFEAFLLAVSLAGLFQIAIGILKAGIIGYYFPTAVIKGMLSAIGVILILKQIPHLLGYDANLQGDESFKQVDGENSFTGFLNTLEHFSIGSSLIGLTAILIIIIWQTNLIQKYKWFKAIPSALLVVIVSILIDLLFAKSFQNLEVKDEHLVKLPVFGSVQMFFNSFTLPDFTALKNTKLYEVAFIIGVVASLETLLSLEAVDKLDPNNQISPPNRELVAQGVGNVLAGLIGGLPITSVIVRSSVNVDSGAKSQLSSIVHGILFLVAVFFIPGLLQMIPLSALAAILIVTGFNLAKPLMFVRIYKQGLDQFLPFIFTFFVMLLSDLLRGVSVGIFISIIFILRQNYRAPFKKIEEVIEGQLNIFVKFSPGITFINKGKFIELFQSVPPNTLVYLDGGRAGFIDKDVLELISAFKQSAKLKNITVHLEDIEEVEILSHH